MAATTPQTTGVEDYLEGHKVHHLPPYIAEKINGYLNAVASGEIPDTRFHNLTKDDHIKGLDSEIEMMMKKVADGTDKGSFLADRKIFHKENTLLINRLESMLSLIPQNLVDSLVNFVYTFEKRDVLPAEHDGNVYFFPIMLPSLST